MRDRIEESDYRAIRKLSREDRVWHGVVKNLLAGVTCVHHHDPLPPGIATHDLPIEVLSESDVLHSLSQAGRYGRALSSGDGIIGGTNLYLHLAEGIDARARDEFEALEAMGGLSSATRIIHGLALEFSQLERLAALDGGLILCPTSNWRLFGALQREAWSVAGLRIALGTDSRLTGSLDLLEELAFAAREFDLQEGQLLSSVTSHAAELIGRPKQGHLRENQPANSIVIRQRPGSKSGEPFENSLRACSRSDLRLVVSRGRPLIGDPDMVAAFEAAGLDFLPVRLDGRPKLMEAELALRIAAAPWQEAGLSIDKNPVHAGLGDLAISGRVGTKSRQEKHALIAHSNFMRLDPKQVEKARPFPPLASLYVAAIARSLSYQVTLFDASLASGPEAFEQALEKDCPDLVLLVEDHFNFLSKMCLATMREAGLRMLRAASDRRIPCIVSASDAVDHPTPFLEAGAQAIVLGEAEWTVADLLRAFDSADAWDESDLAGIPGLVYLDSAGRQRSSAERLPEQNLLRFPSPAFDLVDAAGYREFWRDAHGSFTINMISTRGCPYHCNWCAKPIWGQRYAVRPANQVASEMVLLKKMFAADKVWFADDIFGLHPGWVSEFSSTLKDLGGGLPYTIQSRVDLIDTEMADALGHSECEMVWLGVESGAQTILDAMQKGYELGQLPAACEALRNAGVGIGFFIQLGYPGEGWAEIEATRDMILEHCPDEIGVSVSYPLPGTPFYERVIAELEEKDHWQDSSDLAMLFKGAYPTALYRELHRLLHASLDAEIAWREAGRPSSGKTADAKQAMAEAWESIEHKARAQHHPDPILLQVD